MAQSKIKNASPPDAATRQNQLADIAENTLAFFSETATRARSLLDKNHVMGASTLASVKRREYLQRLVAISTETDELRPFVARLRGALEENASGDLARMLDWAEARPHGSRVN